MYFLFFYYIFKFLFFNNYDIKAVIGVKSES